MSLWLEAEIELNEKHLHPDKDPIVGIKAVFKKYGKNFDSDYSEAEIKRVNKCLIGVSICNPDGYVDTIHNTFKELVEKHPYVSSVRIFNHYYF